MEIHNNTFINKQSFKITLIYFIISFLWILFSDKFVNIIFDNSNTISYIQTIKGWLFITITSIILYFLINKYIQKELKNNQALEKANLLLVEGQKIANMGNWELDLINNNLIWSDQIYVLFGVKPQEFKATYEGFLSYVHPEDRQKVNDAYTNSLKEEKPYFIEHRIIQKNGSVKYVEESCIHKFNEENEVVKSIGVVHDITNKRLIEIEKNNQLHINERLFNNLEISIWNEDFSIVFKELQKLKLEGIKDLNTYLESNSDYLSYLAHSIKVLSVNQITLDMFHVKDEKDFITSISKSFGDNSLDVFKDELLAIWDKKDYFRAEADFITLNNKKLKAIVSFSIPKIEEDFKSIPVSILDITEIKEKEELILYQSKMASMGEMIDNIAHQWRQPLSIISTSASGIKINNELDTLTSEKIDLCMSHINDSTQHLSQTIDDFRNFFKPNKIKKEFYINGTFEKTLNLLASQFNAKNIQIIKNIDEISIIGFENELIQVLVNLINNSRDELLKKDANERYIFISSTKVNNEVCICIKDTAGGINKNIINKIFDARFTTKEDAGGTGIGLYMSKKIVVEHMKGTIEVNNEDFIYKEKSYAGANFKIKLPVFKDKS